MTNLLNLKNYCTQSNTRYIKGLKGYRMIDGSDKSIHLYNPIYDDDDCENEDETIEDYIETYNIPIQCYKGVYNNCKVMFARAFHRNTLGRIPLKYFVR